LKDASITPLLHTIIPGIEDVQHPALVPQRPLRSLQTAGIRAFAPKTRDKAASPGIDRHGALFDIHTVYIALVIQRKGPHPSRVGNRGVVYICYPLNNKGKVLERGQLQLPLYFRQPNKSEDLHIPIPGVGDIETALPVD